MPKFPLGDVSIWAVYWDWAGVKLRIDPVKGAVKFTTEDQSTEIEEESYGDAAVDGVHRGTKISALEMPLTRSTYTQLVGLLPGVALDGSGNLVFSNKCGGAQYENSKQILLKPIVDHVVSVTATEWLLIYKCYPLRAHEIIGERSAQKLHLVHFKVFPNQASGYEGKFYQYGMAT